MEDTDEGQDVKESRRCCGNLNSATTSRPLLFRTVSETSARPHPSALPEPFGDTLKVLRKGIADENTNEKGPTPPNHPRTCLHHPDPRYPRPSLKGSTPYNTRMQSAGTECGESKVTQHPIHVPSAVFPHQNLDLICGHAALHVSRAIDAGRQGSSLMHCCKTSRCCP